MAGWEPTFGQIAERANRLWQSDGCLPGSELEYWLRAKEQLIHENRMAAGPVENGPAAQPDVRR